MINYNDFEKAVYNWLSKKNELDPKFTFSLRQKSSEDTRLDYFVGTEKSRYFALTFWTIPVGGYAGSSGDCINLVFKISSDYRTYGYDLKLTQTNTPNDNQNTSVLNLIKSLTTPIKENIGTSYISDFTNKTNTIRSKPKKEKYTDLIDMLQDIDEDLAKFIPLVNQYIEIEKKKNPEFEAYRITQNEFESMQAKLQKRFEKFQVIDTEPNYWIFQGNPDIYNITNALKAAHLKSWKVAAHKDKIAIGDKVIIWQTGKNAGCYALAEVTSEVNVFEEEQFEKQYYKDLSNSLATNRVKIKIEYSFADSPILWKDIKNRAIYNNFKAGNQGTNFSATKEEYQELTNLINTKNQSSNTKLNDLIQDYKNALINDNWLYVELYKFEWANWLATRVNFEEQTDEEILELCLASQNENYTDSKGVQFIKQGAREKLSKYIGIEDIKIFRDFYNGIALENIDYSARNMSFPILSCWMSVLAPDAVFPASRTSFADIIKEVFFIKLKHSKIDFVIAMQKPMQKICKVLLEDKEITEFISKELDKSELSQLDVNWLVQDFLLYVDRHPNLIKPISDTVEEEVEQYIMLEKMPTNQILYGPPGTGKTYSTINKAIAIANPEFDITQDRILVKEEYARLVKNGQVVFTTFHQSMSYEDFVEGIKPKTSEDKKVTYEVEDGIFKKLADKAKGLKGKITSETNTIDFKNNNYFKMSIGGKNRKDVHDWCIKNDYISLGWGSEENYTEYNNIKNWDTYRNKFKNEFSYLVEDSKYHIQAMFIFQKMNIGDIVLISLGNHSIDAIGIITGEYEYIEDSNIPYRHFRKVKWLATNLDANPSLFVDKNISQQSIYQFNNDDIKVDYLEQTFSKSKEEIINSKNHVLIIDEINRGNVSGIFGELITLLESDKRLGQDEAITAVLPYSKTVFGIPANLYIIGTMNTADRSVEALDTALRRRFEFKEMMPDYSVIENETVNEIKLSEVLEKINKRIELLIDRDHAIGHSYFFNVNSEEKLANAFNTKIVPLLQEYFYGDYGKIGLVLGNGFVEKKKNNDINFADFPYENANDFKIPSFILKKVTKENIVEAVITLLGKNDSNLRE